MNETHPDRYCANPFMASAATPAPGVNSGPDSIVTVPRLCSTDARPGISKVARRPLRLISRDLHCVQTRATPPAFVTRATFTYCIVLYCIVLYCTALLYCNLLYCSVVYCIVLFVFYCIALYCI